MWSADLDPCVLRVRAERTDRVLGSLFDVEAAEARVVRSVDIEHVAIERSGRLLRLDVVEGTVLPGPVELTFEVANDSLLTDKLDAIRAFCLHPTRRTPHQRLARQLLALHAVDGLGSGASLREIAGDLLGPGDWPGEGEHRKSHIRRLIAAGERMIREGPRAILASTVITSSVG